MSDRSGHSEDSGVGSGEGSADVGDGHALPLPALPAGRLVPADGERVTVKSLEKWNKVRVTFHLPVEAAGRLRALAHSNPQTLHALGIFSVQVDGDQISITLVDGSSGAAVSIPSVAGSLELDSGIDSAPSINGSTAQGTPPAQASLATADHAEPSGTWIEGVKRSVIGYLQTQGGGTPPPRAAPPAPPPCPASSSSAAAFRVPSSALPNGAVESSAAGPMQPPRPPSPAHHPPQAPPGPGSHEPPHSRPPPPSATTAPGPPYAQGGEGLNPMTSMEQMLANPTIVSSSPLLVNLLRSNSPGAGGTYSLAQQPPTSEPFYPPQQMPYMAAQEGPDAVAAAAAAYATQAPPEHHQQAAPQQRQPAYFPAYSQPVPQHHPHYPYNSQGPPFPTTADAEEAPGKKKKKRKKPTKAELAAAAAASQVNHAQYPAYPVQQQQPTARSHPAYPPHMYSANGTAAPAHTWNYPQGHAGGYEPSPQQSQPQAHPQAAHYAQQHEAGTYPPHSFHPSVNQQPSAAVAQHHQEQQKSHYAMEQHSQHPGYQGQMRGAEMMGGLGGSRDHIDFSIDEVVRKTKTAEFDTNFHNANSVDIGLGDIASDPSSEGSQDPDLSASRDSWPSHPLENGIDNHFPQQLTHAPSPAALHTALKKEDQRKRKLDEPTSASVCATSQWGVGGGGSGPGNGGMYGPMQRLDNHGSQSVLLGFGGKMAEAAEGGVVREMGGGGGHTAGQHHLAPLSAAQPSPQFRRPPFSRRSRPGQPSSPAGDDVAVAVASSRPLSPSGILSLKRQQQRLILLPRGQPKRRAVETAPVELTALEVENNVPPSEGVEGCRLDKEQLAAAVLSIDVSAASEAGDPSPSVSSVSSLSSASSAASRLSPPVPSAAPSPRPARRRVAAQRRPPAAPAEPKAAPGRASRRRK